MIGGTPNETSGSGKSKGSGDVNAILRIDSDARFTRDTLMINDDFSPETGYARSGTDNRLPPKRQETRH
jgi:hypothetical protein